MIGFTALLLLVGRIWAEAAYSTLLTPLVALVISTIWEGYTLANGCGDWCDSVYVVMPFSLSNCHDSRQLKLVTKNIKKLSPLIK